MKLRVASCLTLLLAPSLDASVSFSTNNDLAAKESSTTMDTKQKMMHGSNQLDGDLLSTIQDQKTVVCPVGNQNLYDGHIQYGTRTRFIVKNTASETVVVAFVEQGGAEVSAANYNIAPAQADPDAWLAPGVSKVFAVNEGHVFHVYSKTTGELLLAHRAGPISIENRFNRQISSCSPKQDENEMKQNITQTGNVFRNMRKFSEWKPAKIEQYNQPVDLDVGFRNSVKSRDGKTCPVNLYYVKRQDENPKRKPNYLERFKFHLGGNNLVAATDDVWDASTKYENTYIGHEFVARLADNENVVVDQLAMEPIQVMDCPNRKKVSNGIKATALGSAIVIPVGTSQRNAADGTHNNTIFGGYYEAFVNLNSFNTTESRRGFYIQMQTE